MSVGECQRHRSLRLFLDLFPDILFHHVPGHTSHHSSKIAVRPEYSVPHPRRTGHQHRPERGREHLKEGIPGHLQRGGLCLFTGHPHPELQGLEQTYSRQRDRSP